MLKSLITFVVQYNRLHYLQSIKPVPTNTTTTDTVYLKECVIIMVDVFVWQIYHNVFLFVVCHCLRVSIMYSVLQTRWYARLNQKNIMYKALCGGEKYIYKNIFPVICRKLNHILIHIGQLSRLVRLIILFKVVYLQLNNARLVVTFLPVWSVSLGLKVLGCGMGFKCRRMNYFLTMVIIHSGHKYLASVPSRDIVHILFLSLNTVLNPIQKYVYFCISCLRFIYFVIISLDDYFNCDSDVYLNYIKHPGSVMYGYRYCGVCLSILLSRAISTEFLVLTYIIQNGI